MAILDEQRINCIPDVLVDVGIDELLDFKDALNPVWHSREDFRRTRWQILLDGKVLESSLAEKDERSNDSEISFTVIEGND